MAGIRTLFIAAVFSLLEELAVAEGFYWIHSDGRLTLNRCVGEEVTFPWDFRLEDRRDLIGISWSRSRGAENKELIATVYAGEFMPSLGDSVTQVKGGSGAGIRMVDLTTADTGLYTVIVRLQGSQDVPQSNASLTVAEMPETDTGTLEVLLSNQVQADTPSSATSNGDQYLMCGRFVSLGVPEVSVLWEDPAGNILESTFFNTTSGYFILVLPDRYKGGDYKCMLNNSALAYACLGDQSPLREPAALKVTARTLHVGAAGLNSGAVAGIVIGVLAVVVAAVVITLVVVLKLYRGRGKRYSPKEKEPDSPDQEMTEPFKA